MPVHVRDPLDPRLSHGHLLAYALRTLRELNGLSLTQVGMILDLTRGTVSNIEATRRALAKEYASVLDERYNTGELIQALCFFAAHAHNPDWAATITEYELEARVLKIYHGQAIPIPFQTEDTVRAQLSAARTVIDLEGAVKARLARQEATLHRVDPPYIWALLEEAALEQQTGGPAVLRSQLAHLRALSHRPNVGIRVIPKTAGSHLGTDGPFRFLTLENRDVAYAGAWRGGRMIEDSAEVREVALDWDFISQKALSDEDTRSLIDRKMEALE